jgi:predicted DNA-binding transcriptional regulator AlpA
MQTDRRIEGDQAKSDLTLCSFFGISKPTLARWRKKHGLPGPSFRVGQMPYTYASEIDAWLKEREAAGVEFMPPTAIKGRPPTEQPEA